MVQGRLHEARGWRTQVKQEQSQLRLSVQRASTSRRTTSSGGSRITTVRRRKAPNTSCLDGGAPFAVSRTLGTHRKILCNDQNLYGALKPPAGRCSNALTAPANLQDTDEGHMFEGMSQESG